MRNAQWITKLRADYKLGTISKEFYNLALLRVLTCQVLGVDVVDRDPELGNYLVMMAQN